MVDTIFSFPRTVLETSPNGIITPGISPCSTEAESCQCPGDSPTPSLRMAGAEQKRVYLASKRRLNFGHRGSRWMHQRHEEIVEKHCGDFCG